MGGLKNMSQQDILIFLKTNKGIGFTAKEIKKRMNLRRVNKKLNPLVKVGMVKTKKGYVNYSNYSNVKVTYFYCGDKIQVYVPKPKKVVR